MLPPLAFATHTSVAPSPAQSGVPGQNIALTPNSNTLHRSGQKEEHMQWKFQRVGGYYRVARPKESFHFEVPSQCSQYQQQHMGELMNTLFYTSKSLAAVEPEPHTWKSRKHPRNPRFFLLVVCVWYACMYVHMQECIYMCVFHMWGLHVHAHACVCIHICVCAFIHCIVCKFMNMCVILHLGICMDTSVQEYMFVHERLKCICMFLYVCVYM